MHIQLLLVPYDSARRGVRLGAGPEHLLSSGLDTELSRGGHRVSVAVVEPPGDAWVAEIGTAFHLMRGVAAGVRGARAAGRFPVVLSGNCNVAVGVVAGLGARTGVVWFDAHGDFNTPETTVGGFLDGMSLATLTGRCWVPLARSVPGFEAVPESSVALVGARDLDPLEAAALEQSRIARVRAEDAPGALIPIIRDMRSAAERLYIHLDLDVLDPSEGQVNCYSAPHGLHRSALSATLIGIADAAPVAALTLSAYDPAMDRDGRVRDAILALAREALEAIARRTREPGA